MVGLENYWFKFFVNVLKDLDIIFLDIMFFGCEMVNIIVGWVVLLVRYWINYVLLNDSGYVLCFWMLGDSCCIFFLGGLVWKIEVECLLMYDGDCRVLVLMFLSVKW